MLWCIVPYVGTSILASGVPETTFIATCPHHAHRVIEAIMSAARERFEFPREALQMIIISHETAAAVQPCLPIVIYSAK